MKCRGNPHPEKAEGTRALVQLRLSMLKKKALVDAAKYAVRVMALAG